MVMMHAVLSTIVLFVISIIVLAGETRMMMRKIQAFSWLPPQQQQQQQQQQHRLMRRNICIRTVLDAVDITHSTSTSTISTNSEPMKVYRPNQLFIFGVGRVGQQVIHQSFRATNSTTGSSRTNSTRFFTNICGTVRNVTSSSSSSSKLVKVNDASSRTNQSICRHLESRAQEPNSGDDDHDDIATTVQMIPFSMETDDPTNHNIMNHTESHSVSGTKNHRPN